MRRKIERRISTKAERDAWYRETLAIAEIATILEEQERGLADESKLIARMARRFRTSKQTKMSKIKGR